MTQEQFEKLEKYESSLNNAVKNSFLHLPAGDFAVIAGIYNEVFDKPLNKAQMNCNTCRLNALKKLGAEYFSFKADIDSEGEPKKKSNKGRPKKLKE